MFFPKTVTLYNPYTSMLTVFIGTISLVIFFFMHNNMSFYLLFLTYLHLYVVSCLFLNSALVSIISSDVGFKVGKNSGMSYFVLQIHYGDVSSFRGES